MEPVFLYTLIFLLGLLGSVIGSIAAGAGLITLPGLLLLGVPPHIALATVKFGGIGFRVGALVNYFKHRLIIWRLVIPMCILGIIGGVIGASLLIAVNKEILTKLVGILLLILLPFLFIKRNVGIVRKKISKTKEVFAHFLYFLARIWGGFFSPGSGFINMYIMINAYGLTILQGKGTTRIPLIISDISGVIVFILVSYIDFRMGIALFLGMLLGGYIGSHIAIKKGNKWIKPIIVIFIILASIKLIFF